MLRHAPPHPRSAGARTGLQAQGSCRTSSQVWLVEFQAGTHVGHPGTARTGGLRRPAELSRYFRDELVREAGELFADA